MAGRVDKLKRESMLDCSSDDPAHVLQCPHRHILNRKSALLLGACRGRQNMAWAALCSMMHMPAEAASGSGVSGPALIPTSVPCRGRWRQHVCHPARQLQRARGCRL